MSIIAISSNKKHHSKLVAQIIQYLVAKKIYEKEDSRVNDYLNQGFDSNWDYTSLSGEWLIKSFDNHLKTIISLLLNCKEEELTEPSSFLSSVLPEDWWFYKHIHNIGEPIPFKAFPQKLEENEFKLYKPTVSELMFNIDRVLKYNIHPNIWINSLMSKYIARTKQFSTFVDGGPMMAKLYPKWIIIGLKNHDELKAVKEKNALTIKIDSYKFPLHSSQNKAASEYLESKGIKPGSQKGNLIVYANKIYDKQDRQKDEIFKDKEFDHVITYNDTISKLISDVKEALTRKGLFDLKI